MKDRTSVRHGKRKRGCGERSVRRLRAAKYVVTCYVRDSSTVCCVLPSFSKQALGTEAIAASSVFSGSRTSWQLCSTRFPDVAESDRPLSTARFPCPRAPLPLSSLVSRFRSSPDSRRSSSPSNRSTVRAKKIAEVFSPDERTSRARLRRKEMPLRSG